MTERKRVKRAHGEGTYTVRSDGRVQYRVLIDGRRIVATGRNRTEAKAKARERAQVLGRRKTTATMRELADEWTELAAAERGLRPTTADNYASLLANHVLPELGEDRLEALTKRRVAQAVQAMGGATSTRRSAYAALVKVLDYAVAQGLLGRNIARDVPRPSRVDAAPRDLTDDEAVRLLRAAKGHRWEVAAWLGLACGMRRGEALGLQWTDVDLTAGVAHVRRNVTRSSAGLVVGEPKTKRGRRMVPLPPAVVAQLKAHRKRQAADQLAAGSAWSDSGHVLTNEAGGVVEPRNLSRAWAGWAAAAGIEDTGTHVGRHYAATTLLASGQASVADVAAMLGHDPAVLLGTYAAAVAQGQRQAADVLGSTLAAGVRKAK
jgi:integrase